MSVGQAPTVHLFEGWWVIWSPSEQRWYKLFDVHTTAGGFGHTTEMHFCHLPCGAYVAGYEWVALDSFYEPDLSRLSAAVLEVSCFDCRTPTPTPRFPRPIPFSTPPTACIWRTFLPYAKGG